MVLSTEAEDFFGAVRAGLDAARVDYEIAPHLVRGLDYYRHTAFEFVTDQLGAQGTVLAGGRYDGLIEQLGGPHTPAVGWAAGIERLALLIAAPSAECPLVTVIPDDTQTEADAIRVVATLRRSGIVADLAFRGNAKRRFELAKKSGSIARVVLKRSSPDGVPDRVGIHVRINKSDGVDRSRDPTPKILSALESEFAVKRFPPVEGASWSPDAVLQEKTGAA